MSWKWPCMKCFKCSTRRVTSLLISFSINDPVLNRFFFSVTVWTRCLPVVSVRSSCKWGKVCKSGLCKFCGRQPLKNLLSPFLNTLSHMLIFHDSPVWILRLSCLITWRQNYIKIWTMLSLEWWSPFVLKFLKITFEQFATNFVVFRVILYGLFLDCFFFCSHWTRL